MLCCGHYRVHCAGEMIVNGSESVISCHMEQGRDEGGDEIPVELLISRCLLSYCRLSVEPFRFFVFTVVADYF